MYKIILRILQLLELILNSIDSPLHSLFTKNNCKLNKSDYPKINANNLYFRNEKFLLVNQPYPIYL